MKSKHNHLSQTKIPLGDLHTEENTFLHNAMQWITNNPAALRRIIFSIIGLAIVVTVAFILYAAAKDEHSRRLHEALETYEQIKILPKGDARQAQMKNFGSTLKEICEQPFSTIESGAACLSGGNAFLEVNDYPQAAALFARAASSYNSEPMISIARFMQAQALEANREFDKALTLYKNLEKNFTVAKKQEMVIFHQARMLYYMGKYDEAEEKFVKLSRENEGKEFAAPSRNYISLLNAERGKQNTPIPLQK
ncbi:MAG TPA: tetratricopeptide repeat protein [Turneriella sp.]|nr:tetratricopeptide repeat protein [Turneriella sp.]